MRIALVTQQYPPHFEGGTELVVRAQARALAARGHELWITAGTDRAHAGRDVLESEVDGLSVAHLPRRADEPYDILLERPRLSELVRERVRGADLVHVHHWSTLTGDLVRRLSGERPVAVTLHDLFSTCPRFFRVPPDAALVCPEPGDVEPCVRCCAPDAGGLAPELLGARLTQRAAAWRAELAAAALLVVPSRAHAAHLARAAELDASLLQVVGHGLCRTLVPPVAEARPAAWRGDRPLVVLHHGHRTSVKGTADLVRAARAVHDQRPGALELVLAGAEVEAGFDARLRQLAGDLPLVFTGAYDGRELERLAAGADLAAVPSRAPESYGLVVDEALALGLPVWTSDRGALGERLGAAGRILPAEDPAAWTAAFMELLDQPEHLARERAASSEAPGARRTADDAARELEALYTSLLSSDRSPLPDSRRTPGATP